MMTVGEHMEQEARKGRILTATQAYRELCAREEELETRSILIQKTRSILLAKPGRSL